MLDLTVLVAFKLFETVICLEVRFLNNSSVSNVSVHLFSTAKFSALGITFAALETRVQATQSNLSD